MKIAAAVAVLLVAGTAHAHFKLITPESSTAQASNGDPQKTAPCGGAGTATNIVTTVQSGSVLTVTINETVPHPGHYRVALAQTEAELPPDPVVTPMGNLACGTAAIQNPPILPILADGQLVHTTSFGGADQSMQVQLPAGMTCTNCVLQVIEYMRGGGDCFYYHCARVTIADDAPAPDAGPGGGNAPDGGPAGNEPDPSEPTTGGCSTGGGSTALVGIAMLWFVRPRRRQR